MLDRAGGNEAGQSMLNRACCWRTSVPVAGERTPVANTLNPRADVGYAVIGVRLQNPPRLGRTWAASRLQPSRIRRREGREDSDSPRERLRSIPHGRPCPGRADSRPCRRALRITGPRHLQAFPMNVASHLAIPAASSLLAGPASRAAPRRLPLRLRPSGWAPLPVRQGRPGRARSPAAARVPLRRAQGRAAPLRRARHPGVDGRFTLRPERSASGMRMVSVDDERTGIWVKATPRG